MRARVRVLLLDYKILLFSYKTNITKKENGAETPDWFSHESRGHFGINWGIEE